MFIVSPPGIHISLGICVWGYTYHGDTHITVPASAWKNNMAALSVEKGPLFKVILLGEAGVGKTSIFYRAKENSFLQHRKNTVGIDSFSMYIKVGDQQVTVSEVSV